MIMNIENEVIPVIETLEIDPIVTEIETPPHPIAVATAVRNCTIVTMIAATLVKKNVVDTDQEVVAVDRHRIHLQDLGTTDVDGAPHRRRMIIDVIIVIVRLVVVPPPPPLPVNRPTLNIMMITMASTKIT